MMIYNLSKKSVVAKHAVYACGFFERGRGMIARKFKDFDAMVFDDCDAIHTCFMGESIDVLFVDCENRVLKVVAELKPWRLLVNCKDSKTVVELPAGHLAASRTEPGDVLDLQAEPSSELLEKLEKDKLIIPEGVAPLKESKIE